MILTVIVALATFTLGAPLDDGIEAREASQFTTNVDIYGEAISIGDISAPEMVRTALDELCQRQTCDTTRYSSVHRTNKAYRGPAKELVKVGVTVTANAAFPEINDDGGQLARDSLKTAMVEAVRLAEQREWKEYSVYPAAGSGIVGMNQLQSKWDWFGTIPRQFSLVRSRNDFGAQAGELKIEVHVKELGPKADFCNVLSHVVGSLAGAIGLFPGAGPMLGFLGSIAARGAASCARSKRDTDRFAYVPNLTNNSYVQSFKNEEDMWAEISARHDH